MIPISSAVSSNATPNTLIWTRGKRGRSYELTFNGQIVGRMNRPSFWSSSHVVETADGRWIFRQSGCFGGAEIVDESSGQTIATIKASWGTGGGTLTFADGQKFALVVSGWWHPVWVVTADNGELIARLHARERTLELPSGADAVRGRLSLLAMFVYYRMLRAEEDAAAGAVVAAVS